jgi:endonuclease-3
MTLDDHDGRDPDSAAADASGAVPDASAAGASGAVPDASGADASLDGPEPSPSAPAASAAALPRDRKARAARVLEILDRIYPVVEIPLDHGDPFQLLVATILSAQCTDARVNMVTPALFARAADAAAMAKLQPRQIMPYIRTCGLAPSKASSIAKMSRILVAKHGGQVPPDLAALEDLPGVGHKTASVVMAQAFQEPAFPVDTHIHRLAGRWQLSRARTVEEVERDLKALFPRDRWSTLHLQIIYFGREYCTARQHDPAACPICSWAMSKARADAERRQGLSKPVRGAGKSRAPRPSRAAKPSRTAKPSPTAAPSPKPSRTAKRRGAV